MSIVDSPFYSFTFKKLCQQSSGLPRCETGALRKPEVKGHRTLEKTQSLWMDSIVGLQ